MSEHAQAAASVYVGTRAHRRELPNEDDMIDETWDCDEWPFLKTILGGCRDPLVKLYLESNVAAIRRQTVHRKWVAGFASFGTLAVTVAIVQLAWFRDNAIVLDIELGAVLIAFVALAFGNRTRSYWLTERHRAEHCRLLKFAAIIDPALWSSDATAGDRCLADLARRIEELRRMSHPHVRGWLEKELASLPPGRFQPRSLDEVRELRDYYCHKRLDFQCQYFESKLKPKMRRHPEPWRRRVLGALSTWLRRLPPWFFLGSVAAVLAHSSVPAIVALAGYVTGETYVVPSRLEVGLVACAALLPAWSSGIRTYLSAGEAARNLVRFRAKLMALRNISERLSAGQPLSSDVEAEAVLRDLWYSEQILEAEHREWLRLMRDAEWRS